MDGYKQDLEGNLNGRPQTAQFQGTTVKWLFMELMLSIVCAFIVTFYCSSQLRFGCFFLQSLRIRHI